MTNVNAESANGKGVRKMTRDEMQNTALIIESLLDAAMALNLTDSNEDMLRMIEMAHDRAAHLNTALDSVNAPEGM